MRLAKSLKPSEDGNVSAMDNPHYYLGAYDVLPQIVPLSPLPRHHLVRVPRCELVDLLFLEKKNNLENLCEPCEVRVFDPIL